MTGSLRSDLRQLQRIAFDVRVSNYFIALIVMPENQDAIAERLLGRFGPFRQFLERKIAVDR